MEQLLISLLRGAGTEIDYANEASTPESVQAHALLSIAQSLLALAEMEKWKRQ